MVPNIGSGMSNASAAGAGSQSGSATGMSNMPSGASLGSGVSWGSQQNNERIEHVRRLREKFLDYVGQYSTTTTITSVGNGSTSPKLTDDVKKQRFTMETISKLFFLDEFYDALNLRVRTFGVVADVVKALDKLSRNLLVFAERRFNYVRTRKVSNSGSMQNRNSIQLSSTILHKDSRLSKSSELASKGGSSEDMGSMISSKEIDQTKYNYLEEFATTLMDSGDTFPTFQHERLKDLIVGVFLEIQKGKQGGEEKMKEFLNSAVKRATVDIERNANTLSVNSNRKSLNATNVLLNTTENRISFFNADLSRTDSAITLEKILHMEENAGDRLANDIQIITDMFLIELDDQLALFHEKNAKFIKSWLAEATEKCLFTYQANDALKKRKEVLKTLKEEYKFAEDDFNSKFVIEKDWQFTQLLSEYTSDWKMVCKNLPSTTAWSSSESYSTIPDMKLTKFVGYFDFSLENAMRALCHDDTMEKFYNSKVTWHEYNAPCASSSLEKYPTTVMTSVNESGGLYKKQPMELVLSSKTKFIGSGNMTELVQGSLFFKSCNLVKNTKESESNRFITIGAKYVTKVDNNRVRVLEVRCSKIAGFLKKTFMFSINMKKEMGLFYTNIYEILSRESEQGFPLPSQETNNLMKAICDYSKTYCSVDFGEKYARTDDDIVL